MAIHPTAEVHPTAVIEAGAEIGEACRIGPYCVIGAKVGLGPGVTLHSHVAVAGRTTIGEATQVFPFASLGHVPQDLKYRGEDTALVIGARNAIREHVTMNPGTEGGGGITEIGDDNLFMVATHVAHDCRIGSHVIMANNATLGGHVVVEDFVILGGLAGVVADVIPYGSVVGERAHLAGLNLVGLKRRNAARADINGLRAAFDAISRGEGTLQERVRLAGEAHPGNPLVREIVDFVTAESSRSFTVPAD